MRFAELSLERYGRFEGCTLSFRPGLPDIHVIYGANEAGKSTTLAAVSDLLFGFPPRSPYNFRFDYGLLRIGAVLEEGDLQFACRRRKAQNQSLVDDQDQPIDEGQLHAMLKGQSREAFRLGFSLDQTQLREGGRAMVDARHDLGQALFAAGSGIVEVPAMLDALKKEADDIWGTRAAARRTYTIAERQLADAQHRLRDEQLRPKAWSEARQALERESAALADLQAQRVELAQARRQLERLRRIGADAQRRKMLLAAMASAGPVPCLTSHTETSAAETLKAYEQAERARAAAAGQLEALLARIDETPPDPKILAAAEEIDALAVRRGAELKAAVDLVRLQGERAEKLAQASGLRSEIDGAPTAGRAVVARLRELAVRDAELKSLLSEAQTSQRDAEANIQDLRKTLAEVNLDVDLPSLEAAIDAARALGADIDARCEDQARALQALREALRISLERLSPWSGSIDALQVLSVPSAEELDGAQTDVAQAREDAASARIDAERAGQALSEAMLDRRTMAEGGVAVSAEAVVDARTARDGRWAALQSWLLGGTTPSDPSAETQAFEASVAEADTVADRRFASAEASGRLAALDATLEKLGLADATAQARQMAAAARSVSVLEAWLERLREVGSPPLEPVRLKAWLVLRQAALDTAERIAVAAREQDATLNRRAAARAGLAACVVEMSDFEAEPQLAPIQARADRQRSASVARNLQFSESRTTLKSWEDRLSEQSRKASRYTADRASGAESWSQTCSAAGLTLAIEGAEHRLAVMDELRNVEEAAEGLARRIEGIERDAAAFGTDLAATAKRVDQPDAPSPAALLDALRARLATAQSHADARAAHETTKAGFEASLRTAQAEKSAAEAGLAPRLAELGLSSLDGLPEALEASRQRRAQQDAVLEAERRIAEAGEGYALADLVQAFSEADPDTLASQLQSLDMALAELDNDITRAADAVGSARRAFEALETKAGASDAAQDAALARAELDAQAELYILKRAEAVTLRWALDRYRERQQNPLLRRASELFRTLTLGRYSELRVDLEATTPRLLGLTDDGAALVEVEQMSEGTSDQLFLALRLAAVEQSVAAGTRLPFLADDLFVNFDDDRARAGLTVLAELAKSTQVLVFTHHAHMIALAREVVGAETLSECPL